MMGGFWTVVVAVVTVIGAVITLCDRRRRWREKYGLSADMVVVGVWVGD